MKVIKTFKNNELLTFTENNKIKIFIDDNYIQDNITKGYQMNLIDSNKGSYKGSFMNNYICKKFISNQKVNITNIETNKILNYCKYFLLSENEYIDLNLYNEYENFWFLRSPSYNNTITFSFVGNVVAAGRCFASHSLGFIPFFLQERKLKNENNKNF